MVFGNVICSNWGFSCVFFALWWGDVIELLPNDKQTSGELLSIITIVANKKSLFSLGHDKLGNIHVNGTQ